MNKRAFLLSIVLLLIICIPYFDMIPNYNQIFIMTKSTRQEVERTIKKILTDIRNNNGNSKLTVTSITSTIISTNKPPVASTIASTNKSPIASTITPTYKPSVASTINPASTTQEPNDFYFPKGQDNTKPLDETNLLKELPLHGCTNNTNLLVGVRASPKEFIEREWIRNNWGKYRDPEVPLVFLIGNTNNETIRNNVDEEIKKYGDILLLNFDDHYRNLSVKNYALYKYFDEYCPNANCLLKPDSDTVTNIHGFERLCNLSSPDKKVYTSAAFNAEIGRQSGGRWYVPHYVYPKKKYETFAIGWGFLLTGKNSVKDFLNALRNKTPFLTSENYRRLPDDAIQHGEVRILANISLKDVGGFGFGGVSFWKDPITNESIPLMSEAGSIKKEVWNEFFQHISENKLKKVITEVQKIDPVKGTLKTNNTQVEKKLPYSAICQMLSMLSKEDLIKLGDIRKHCS